jgi:hypothetical protein
MKPSRYLLAVGCACAVPLGLIACGSDDTATKTTTTGAAAAPEDVIAPAAEVVAGLTNLKTVATAISRQTDSAASKQASKGLEPVWQPVEGAVKRNEPDLYATIEEDLSLLESGDVKKTRTGARELGRTVDAYLAKHPG